MSKLRMSLLGLVAVCLASMFTAAAASAAGPFWHTNGSKLKQQSVGVKLQNKGALSLKGEVARLEVTITCGRSGNNDTIEGQGETKQGQGKGIAKFEQCKTTTSGGGECRQPAAVTSNPLKAHLATTLFQGREQIIVLLEASPSQQTTSIVNIAYNECAGSAAILNGLSVPVRGSVAGVVEPQEAEGQEGSIFFPSEPFKSIKHEGQEPNIGLTLNGSAVAILTGYYGIRGQSGTSGVFRT